MRALHWFQGLESLSGHSSAGRLPPRGGNGAVSVTGTATAKLRRRTAQKRSISVKARARRGASALVESRRLVRCGGQRGIGQSAVNAFFISTKDDTTVVHYLLRCQGHLRIGDDKERCMPPMRWRRRHFSEHSEHRLSTVLKECVRF